MTARAAYAMFYDRVTAGRSDEVRLEIDALLGDEGATEAIERREREILEQSGAVEFG